MLFANLILCFSVLGPFYYYHKLLHFQIWIQRIVCKMNFYSNFLQRLGYLSSNHWFAKNPWWLAWCGAKKCIYIYKWNITTYTTTTVYTTYTCTCTRPATIHQCTGTSRYFLPRYEYRILNKLSRYLRYIYICINKHGEALSSISAHPPSAF